MKKLIISLCLTLLCMAIFSSRVYAVWIADINEFVQHDGSDIFTDPFADGDEPPFGPYTNSDYSVFGTIASDRESDGKLELNSDDGMIFEGLLEVFADVSNSTYYFNSGTGSSTVTGKFYFGDVGLPDLSHFGIEILNINYMTNYDVAWLAIENDGSEILAIWGDENDGVIGSLPITAAFNDIEDSIIDLQLILDNDTGAVDAFLDYGGGFVSIATAFTTLFNLNESYTGGFYAGAPPIPEPTTIALLGIGLVGLAGIAVRRRFKKARKER